MERGAIRTELALVTTLGLLAAGPGAVARVASDRTVGESHVFVTVPPPGNPEGIVLDGKTVITGTTIDGFEVATGGTLPSRIFAFDRRTGAPEYSIEMEGEDLRHFHGVAGMALDADGRLYASVLQLGILRFGAGKATADVYGEPLPDLPSCLAVSAGTPCSPTPDDRTPLGNDIVFDDAGNLYVTDSFQSTIFRYPAGGGEAEIWFQDPRLDGVFGPNGIRVSPDGRHMYVAVTEDRMQIGRVFRLPLVADPKSSDLEEFASFPFGGADGIEFGAGGDLYVTLGNFDEIAVIRPDGTEERRLGSEHFHNPASLVFVNKGSLLVTNHAFFDPDPSHHTVVEMFVAEKGAPLARPDFPE